MLLGRKVWGFYNTVAPRDSEALRRVATISREFGDVLTGTIFRPHVPYSLYDGVFVSEFATTAAEGELNIATNRFSTCLLSARSPFDSVGDRVI